MVSCSLSARLAEAGKGYSVVIGHMTRTRPRPDAGKARTAAAQDVAPARAWRTCTDAGGNAAGGAGRARSTTRRDQAAARGRTRVPRTRSRRLLTLEAAPCSLCRCDDRLPKESPKQGRAVENVHRPGVINPEGRGRTRAQRTRAPSLASDRRPAAATRCSRCLRPLATSPGGPR